MYLTNSKCFRCSELITIDEVKNYNNLCEKCCAMSWSLYEKAHGGVVKIDFNRKAIGSNVKNYILQRDKVCLKCGTDNDLTIDHIMPVSLGGDNHHSNLQTLCRSCNSIKCNYPADYREVIEL